MSITKIVVQFEVSKGKLPAILAKLSDKVENIAIDGMEGTTAASAASAEVGAKRKRPRALRAALERRMAAEA